MRAQSISILKVIEGISAFLQDKMGVPVETLISIVCLTHIDAIRHPVILELVTVVVTFTLIYLMTVIYLIN